MMETIRKQSKWKKKNMLKRRCGAKKPNYYYYYTHVRVYVNSKSTYSHVPEDRQSGQGGKQK